MKKFMALSVIFGFYLTSASMVVKADEVERLEDVFGNFSVDEKGDTEVGLIIHGPFAKKIWDSMKSKPTEDICTGGLMKVDQSGMTCALETGGFIQCSFGYNFRTQKLTDGPLVC